MSLRASYEFSERDLAKYPFLREASGYVKRLGFTVRDLESEVFKPVLDRAYNRIAEALEKGIVSLPVDPPEVEIVSFPVAVTMVRWMNDDFLVRRYALAESLRARELLEREAKPVVEAIASRLGFRVLFEEKTVKLHFIDYIRYAFRFHDPRWKLVNREVRRGWVKVSVRELVRLLSEAIQGRMVEMLAQPLPHGTSLPKPLQARLLKVQALLSERKRKGVEEVPTGFVEEALPPCVKMIYEALKNGRNIPHVARFTVAAFLLTIGLTVDDIVKLFTSLPDIDESITRYQVEHIAGKRGSMTKYTPPSCSTLRTHGLCPEPQECGRLKVKHPLFYYKFKVRQFLKGKEEE